MTNTNVPAPLPAVASNDGVVLLTPEGGIELRRICRGAWEWVGRDETRRPLVRPALA